MSNRRALIVEDEVLAGMLIEERLRELGYEIAGLSPHLDQAVALARTAAFDVALLDINLNGRQSLPVADAVRACGLPFLLATGFIGPRSSCALMNQGAQDARGPMG